MFSSESPLIPVSISKRKSPKIIPNTILSAAVGFCFVRDSKKEFEIAMVNKPSVFKPLKVYCIRNFCEEASKQFKP